MMLTTSRHSRATNQTELKIAEEAHPVEDVHQGRAEGDPGDGDGVPAPVHVGQLVGVEPEIVQRGRGELPHERADQAGDRDEDDLEDREADAGQGAPGGRAETTERVDEGRRGPARAEADGGDDDASYAVTAEPAAVRPAATSATRSSTSSSPTETRTRPWGSRPAGAPRRTAGDGCWRADGRRWSGCSPATRCAAGWTGRRGRRRRPRSPRSKASMPPPARSSRCGHVRLGVAGAARVHHAAAPRAVTRGTARAPGRFRAWRSMRTWSVSIPRRTQEGAEGRGDAARVDLDGTDLVDELAGRPPRLPARPSDRRSTLCTTRRQGRRPARAGDRDRARRRCCRRRP